MKLKHTITMISTFAAALIMAAACTNDNNVAVDNDTPAAVPISITLDGQVYGNDTNITGSLGDNGETGFFLSGKSYEYTIRLKKNSLEVTGATITEWTTGGGSTGDATLQS